MTQPAPAPLGLLLELCSIASPPGDERAVADRVITELEAMGLAWSEDDCGARIGSNTGNIVSRIPGRRDGGLPIFLCAHLDTVPLDGPLEPVVDGEFVRNAGGTILGADNKAAVVVMLEAVRRILAEGRPHAGVELVFTPMEEVGLFGAMELDLSSLEARLGYVYDQAAPLGEIVLGSPSAQELELRFHGRASHAGMYPEDGRSSIVAAARAIADMPLGRVDDETTANVGVIRGGTARNVVPEWCTLEAEVRSHDVDRLSAVVQQVLDAAAFAASVSDCELETHAALKYRGYRFAEDELPVRLAAEAVRRTGIEPSFALSGGAADANVFNVEGLPCVNLANGMTDIHTPDERIAVADLEAMVDVTLALVDVAREA